MGFKRYIGKIKKASTPEQTAARKKDDSLRDRLGGFSASGGHDIGSIWEDQTLDIKDQQSIVKKKKRISKSVVVSPKPKKLLGRAKTVTKAIKSSAKKQQNNSAAYRKRLLKILSHDRSKISVRISTLKSKKVMFVAVITAVSIGLFGALFAQKSDEPKTLGESDAQQFTSETLPREKPEFDLLFPSGKSDSDYEVVKISPNNNDPAYTYLDKIANIPINITQQQLPEKLKTDQVTNLENLAKDFQATNKIQINEQTVYHGYNEKSKVQSIIFIKEKVLFLVRAQQIVADDDIVGFVIGLN